MKIVRNTVFVLMLMPGLLGAQVRPSRASLSNSDNIIVTVKGLGCTSSGSDAFDIFAYSWGTSNPSIISPGGQGTSAGKPSLSSVNIEKRFDSCSTALFKFSALGQKFPQLVLVQTDKNGDTTFEMVLTDVFVESLQLAGSSGGDDAPIESVSFVFKQIQVIPATGGPTCYDVTTQTLTCKAAPASPKFP